MKKILIILLSIPFLLNAQKKITGTVVDSNNNITGATFEVSFETPAAAMTVRDDIQWSVCTNSITITNSQVTLTVQDDPNDH